jgi:DNA-binding CsgD family transcriptional regulator/PAS domain-containing protein
VPKARSLALRQSPTIELKPATGAAAMNETERVSRLIDDIYDAALDPAQWARLLARMPRAEDVRGRRHALVEAVHGILSDQAVACLPGRHLEILAAHFRRALAIGTMIDGHRREAARLADALDGFATGMFLLDAQARIVHANQSGQAILDAGAVVRERASRLTPLDRQAAHALRRALVAAAAGEAGRSAIPLGWSNGKCWDAHVLPLTASARRQSGLPHAAVAAVFVRQAKLDPCPLDFVGELYALTPAELRVLSAIVEIGGVPEVAPALGVSETTVKSHLQRVFEKTGTRRQADLVKLVASHMSPLA